MCCVVSSWPALPKQARFSSFFLPSFSISWTFFSWFILFNKENGEYQRNPPFSSINEKQNSSKQITGLFFVLFVCLLSGWIKEQTNKERQQKGTVKTIDYDATMLMRA